MTLLSDRVALTLILWIDTDEGDTCYFAYSYPYTYSDLQNYLTVLENDNIRRYYVTRRSLCQTLAGNNCDMLMITSPTEETQPFHKRKGIVLTARVHPGESNSSWMMKGIIDYLTGTSLDAKILRDNFVFKIVPMLNPDGVISGNYRCSLSGEDLNRRWIDPDVRMYPTIWHVKRVIQQLQLERDVILFCDLHGHSKKKNIFMYGCSDNSSTPRRIITRIFPRILWKTSQNFSFQDCSFAMQKSKESTARVVVYKQFGLINSYTMEASFCGANFGRNNEKHFNTRHYEQMGHFLCEAILDFCDPDQSRVNMVVKELEYMYGDNMMMDEEGEDSDQSDDGLNDDVKEKGKKKKKKKKKKKGKGSVSASATPREVKKKSSKKKSRTKLDVLSATVQPHGMPIIPRVPSNGSTSSKETLTTPKLKTKKKEKKEKVIKASSKGTAMALQPSDWVTSSLDSDEFHDNTTPREHKFPPLLKSKSEILIKAKRTVQKGLS